jgi:hypothetical protein
MSRTVTINGQDYEQPDQGTPPPWGDTQAEIIEALATTLAIQKPDIVSNLGIVLSGGILTITDTEGNSLSEDNPGQVFMYVNGLPVTIQVTVSQQFKAYGSGASVVENVPLGVTSGVNWGEDMPFFINLVNISNSDVDGVDGHSSFFISRYSICSGRDNSTISAVGLIGCTGSPPSYVGVTPNSPFAMMLLGTYTKATYVFKPAITIGCFRMTWSASTTDWTILDFESDGTWVRMEGLGLNTLQNFAGITWSVPSGQCGAAANSLVLPNGGTAPTFSSVTGQYQLTLDGTTNYRVLLSGDGGTAGAGAVSTFIGFSSTIFPSSVFTYGSGYLTLPTGTYPLIVTGDDNGGFNLKYFSTISTLNQVTNSLFTNGSREISFNVAVMESG